MVEQAGDSDRKAAVNPINDNTILSDESWHPTDKQSTYVESSDDSRCNCQSRKVG